MPRHGIKGYRDDYAKIKHKCVINHYLTWSKFVSRIEKVCWGVAVEARLAEEQDEADDDDEEEQLLAPSSLESSCSPELPSPSSSVQLHELLTEPYNIQAIKKI